MGVDVLRDFSLDAGAASVLVTYQSKMTHKDVSGTNDSEKSRLKVRWHQRWRDTVQKGFSELAKEDSYVETPRMLGQEELRREVEGLKGDRVKASLVLLELVCFEPYFPLDEDSPKAFKGISLDKKQKEMFLRQASGDLGIPPERVEQLQSAMRKATNSLTGRWWKMGLGVLAGLGLGALTLGIAAPFVGGLVGAGMGLYGAAATAAGLAAIGGGAVAAGGLGMAGGVAILVGGGALLGRGAGGMGGYFLSFLNYGTALVQSVKLEVALKEIILQGQYDVGKAQQILFQQRAAIQSLENKIDQLRLSGEEDESRIRDLEKALKVMQTALKRNQDLVRQAS